MVIVFYIERQMVLVCIALLRTCRDLDVKRCEDDVRAVDFAEADPFFVIITSTITGSVNSVRTLLRGEKV